MATVSITIPAGTTADVLAAFQAAYPNDWAAAQAAGKTAAQFAQQKVVAYVEDLYRAFKTAQPASPPPAGVS